MGRKTSMIALGLALAGGALYLALNTGHVPSENRDKLVRRDVPAAPAPVMQTVCVENIQNLSHQPVNMAGVEDELVVQLQKAGFQYSRKISEDNSRQCDATINAELVEVSGRGRKTAKVDFRLTLTGEQPPRMSATAVGKSNDNQMAKFASSFRPAEASPQSDKERAEHEALFAAVEQQAHLIQDAYKRGLPPWLPASQ
jgi:hypothetical protein